MFDKFMMGLPVTAKEIWGSAVALEAAAGVKATWPALEGFVVDKVGIYVTVAFNYDTQTTEGVLKFYKRVTPNSDTDRVELASIPLVHGYAAYKTYFKKVDNALNAAKVERGQEVIAQVTTQGAGGTEVGDYYPFWTGHPCEESYPNLNAYAVDIDA
jgi:hypothetical protein